MYRSDRRKLIKIIEEVRDDGVYLRSNFKLSHYGQECPICGKLTPFDGWGLCEICEGNSVCGEPYDDDFDEESYIKMTEKVIEYIDCLVHNDTKIYRYKYIK